MYHIRNEGFRYMTDTQLDRLLYSMSIDEKVFQLSQLPSTFYNQGLQIPGTDVQEAVSREQMNQMGSILYSSDIAACRKIQEEILGCQPHHIPILFMMDVIHGFKTIFPIPLAQAGSFDMDLISRSAAAAAGEASEVGIHVVF